jgi:hypothetical protein
VAREINFKGLIIGVIALFCALMVAAWVIAARVNPKMIRTSEQTPTATPMKTPKTTLHSPPKSR